MGPYNGVDYNLTLCRLQHITMGKRMPESTLFPSKELRIWPQAKVHKQRIRNLQIWLYTRKILHNIRILVTL